VTMTAPLCDAGVLGALDMPRARDEGSCEPLPLDGEEGADGGVGGIDAEPVEAPAGDQLIVRSAVLDESRLRELHEKSMSRGQLDALLERCASMRDAREETDAPPIAFEIRVAYQDRLVVRRSMVTPIGMVSDYTQVLECLGPGPLELDVRTLDSFVVLGSQSGFQHRVVKRENDGRCTVDAKVDPLRTGRAWRGCEFRNRKLQLRPSLGGGDRPDREPPRGLVLQLDLATSGVTMSFDARRQSLGVSALVPTMLKYNAINRYLYLVDSYRGGLIPISTDPFPETAGGSFY